MVKAMDDGSQDTYLEEMRIRKIVALNSRAIREERRLSTSYVSLKSGISRHTISAIENMQTDFSLSTIVRLAEAEGVTSEQLLSSTGTLPSFITFHSKEARDYYAQEIRDIMARYSAREEQELVESGYRKEIVLEKRKHKRRGRKPQDRPVGNTGN